jgi:hypothetical protein
MNYFKKRNIDSFYKKIGFTDSQISLYQYFFNKIFDLLQSDFKSLEKFVLTGKESKKPYIKFVNIVEKYTKEIEENKLRADVLMIFFLQYVMADTIEREMYKKSWIEKVVNREAIDFFPSPGQIIHTFFT